MVTYARPPLDHPGRAAHSVRRRTRRGRPRGAPRQGADPRTATERVTGGQVPRSARDRHGGGLAQKILKTSTSEAVSAETHVMVIPRETARRMPRGGGHDGGDAHARNLGSGDHDRHGCPVHRCPGDRHRRGPLGQDTQPVERDRVPPALAGLSGSTAVQGRPSPHLNNGSVSRADRSDRPAGSSHSRGSVWSGCAQRGALHRGGRLLCCATRCPGSATASGLGGH